MNSTKTLISLAQWEQGLLIEDKALLRLARANGLVVYDELRNFFTPVETAQQIWALEPMDDLEG